MKKKLIIIGSILGVLVLCFVLLFPFLMNKRNNNKLMNNSNSNNVTSEELYSSFDEIIAKYQKYLSYPRNSAHLLNLNIGVGDFCYGVDECNYRYTYEDLNNDEVDELIIVSDYYSYLYVADIYYFDGMSVKSLYPGGFIVRNQPTILENGQFLVHGSNGAESWVDEYYGNVKSPKEKVTDWEDFGLILEYNFEHGDETYIKYDENHKSKPISKKEFDELVLSFGKSVDINKWEWQTITKDPNITADEFKVVDYFYLPDKDKFVKGISLGEKFYSDIIMSRDKLYIQYPKLFNIAKEIGYDMTFCIITSEATNGQHKCEVDLSTYKYPTFYQIQSSGNWEFFFTSSDIYYDTDEDGYVDSTGNGYFIAPINQYDSKYGPLV